jgi:hypothetical protein
MIKKNVKENKNEHLTTGKARRERTSRKRKR